MAGAFLVTMALATLVGWWARGRRTGCGEQLALSEARLLGALERSRLAGEQATERLRTALSDSAREEAIRAHAAEAKQMLAIQQLGASVSAAVEASGARLGEKTLERLSSLGLQVEAALLGQRDAVLDRIGRDLLELRQATARSLDAVRGDTERHLEAIRTTVDERLQVTLEARLGESFRLVSDQLERVFEGLGEMRALARGVGDLQRVLSNVKSRGTFGEVQLGALLEQVLAPEQFVRNMATVPGATERVEYAIRLPGPLEDGPPIWLPVDAKFPQEDYLRLQHALEVGDGPAATVARTGLRARALLEAETIREKYVRPPHTTDFALLFLPTEGLHAELLRIDGLTDELQQKHRVIAVGPTNLYALLSSLQMGFRTLAIEKRSSEVWRVLGGVKAEFGRFGESLDAVRRKIDEAGHRIDDAARRSRAVARRLREVETLPQADASGGRVGAHEGDAAE